MSAPDTDLYEHQSQKKSRPQGIYLLPNLFTTANLFAGFFGILAAMRGDFEAAAIAIFVALVMDGLDGRIARMTQTQTAFGAEYDSLTDMVSFGLAPALIVFQWGLSGFGNLGWIVAFVYTAGAALRLARFNTQIGIADKRWFQGLPSPAAAALVAGLVWIGTDFGWRDQWLYSFALVLTALAGVLMVSKVRYYSFKDVNLRNRVPFVAILLVVLGFALISLDPPQMLFYGFLIYLLSGPIYTLVERRRLRRLGVRSPDAAEEGASTGLSTGPRSEPSER
jgi:CDP-diacylglycerol--serine O-phosphatidyltransferase